MFRNSLLGLLFAGAATAPTEGCIKEAAFAAQPLTDKITFVYYVARGCTQWQTPELVVQATDGSGSLPVPGVLTHIDSARQRTWAFFVPTVNEGETLIVKHHGQWLATFCGPVPREQYVQCYASWALVTK